ncbi:MAG: rlmKL, partial [Proteobacteria bacterium]|nr:rlmKL [Pseudomonadota bacterium]
MTAPRVFFATAPLGLERLLFDELTALGVDEVAEARSGVAFAGPLSAAYRVCLWSRLANRVLLKLHEFPAATPEALYAGVSAMDWSEHMAPDASLAVDFSTVRSQISHTRFGAQKVKDAIVDQFRELCGVRPSVNLDRPELRVNVYLERDVASVSLDLSGDSLHKRGYRLEGGAAPLKENLAAAILLRAGWPEISKAGGDLIDPMCGSGTLPIEAALMAADIAPGLRREYFGFQGWKQHDAAEWERLLAEARERQEAGLKAFAGTICGYDIDRRAIHAALGNVERAGLRGRVHVERRAVADVRPRGPRNGLLVVNPPYGERLGEVETLGSLYAELGQTLQAHFQGWNASLLTGNPDLAFRVGIRAKRYYKLYNGALECKLFNFEVDPERFFTPHGEGGEGEVARLLRRARSLAQQPSTAGAEMFANRLRKNLRNLGRWARQNQIACYRLYDADLPEYALAVDLYQGEQRWLHVQEYEAPSSVDPKKAEERLLEALSVLPGLLEIAPEQMFLKVRRRQKGTAQYEKQAEARRFHAVEEGGCRFWVNFEDYLDTGLFLDHRPTRLMIQKLASGKRFLNLFAYTGSATVHAAVGGAVATTTVDMSRTYLDWARRNLELNGISGKAHEIIQANCLSWLEAEAARGTRHYDLIFLDPPTFSNSKRMDESFDIQRDHPDILRKAASLLA